MARAAYACRDFPRALLNLEGYIRATFPATTVQSQHRDPAAEQAYVTLPFPYCATSPQSCWCLQTSVFRWICLQMIISNSLFIGKGLLVTRHQVHSSAADIQRIGRHRQHGWSGLSLCKCLDIQRRSLQSTPPGLSKKRTYTTLDEKILDHRASGQLRTLFALSARVDSPTKWCGTGRGMDARTVVL